MQLVGEAGKGEEAIQLVDQLDPAVVLMDINMPKMIGIEVTKELWSTTRDHHPLSVNATDTDHEAIRRAGAVQLTTKEAAVEQLYDSIQKAMKKRRHGVSFFQLFPLENILSLHAFTQMMPF
jgi:DNA-binding NarL/FixJ family response regulator